jgi:hypothetical protein
MMLTKKMKMMVMMIMMRKKRCHQPTDPATLSDPPVDLCSWWESAILARRVAYSGSSAPGADRQTEREKTIGGVRPSATNETKYLIQKTKSTTHHKISEGESVLRFWRERERERETYTHTLTHSLTYYTQIKSKQANTYTDHNKYKYIHSYIHRHTYTYAHTHTHTHTWKDVNLIGGRRIVTDRRGVLEMSPAKGEQWVSAKCVCVH